ncbi:MAG: phosphoribosylanthranilate isomerase [Candidatus Andersenbacteria bacterium]
MLIQIYETQSATEARALVKAGVDHIGVLVGEGKFPREKSSTEAQEIFATVRPPAKRVALFLSHDRHYMAEILKQLKPDIVQIGTFPDQFSPEDAGWLKKECPTVQLMRVIPVTGPESIEEAKRYDGIADFLLTDTVLPKGTIIGATGKTHDWNLDRQIVESVKIPVVIAGGLGPDNVAAAIATSHPAGVDCKSKTDAPDGTRKDLKKVAAFVAAVRAAASDG